MQDKEPALPGQDLNEQLGWAEFCAWSALIMTPLIWWLQGPSVSTDQFVVRTSLLVIAGIAAIVLRMWNYRRGRRSNRSSAKPGSSDASKD